MQIETFYYIGLYLIIFMVRFFKLLPLIKEDKEGVQYNYYHLAYFSLEISYTAAGLIILLLSEKPEWQAGVVIGYVIILIFSSLLDSQGTMFTDKVRCASHMIIIIIVLSCTVYSFENVLNQSKENNNKPRYKVAIPYYDITLNNHLGGKLGERYFVYVDVIEADSEIEAINLSKTNFWNDQNIIPYTGKEMKNNRNLFLYTENAVIEQLK